MNSNQIESKCYMDEIERGRNYACLTRRLDDAVQLHSPEGRIVLQETILDAEEMIDCNELPLERIPELRARLSSLLSEIHRKFPNNWTTDKSSL